MGISDFYNVIKEHCPHVLAPIKLSQLFGQNIAVDVSIFLNKYVKSAGTERWLDCFIIFLCSLKRNGIKPVCIFDGPNPPVEKKLEQQRRRGEAAKKQERINYGKMLAQRIRENYLILDQELPSSIIEEVKSVMGKRIGKGKDGFGRPKDDVNFNDPYSVYAGLNESIERQTRQNLPILPIYSTKAKEIIEIMGFSHFQADGEAETLCAGMCVLGLVDAVLSEDTDVLVYGTPFLLSKLDLSTETINIVSHEFILDGLGLDHEEFVDLCILLSCDYNSRISGYAPDGKQRKKPAPVGAKGAFAMIDVYRRLEEAEPFIHDIEPLNYRRCRELFTPPETLPNISIPLNKKIDENRLVEFMKENQIKTNLKYILDTWKPMATINFEIEEEDIESD